jgi:putative GTP pyrophosphokinase
VAGDIEVESLYRSRLPVFEATCALIENSLLHSLEGIPHLDRINFRTKSPESFMAKAERYVAPLEDIEDQIAGRVIVFFVEDIERVSDAATSTWNVIEELHREPERDAEFGYETWHKVFVIPEYLKAEGWSEHRLMPATFELQIRTVFMHAYAEPQHDFVYKTAQGLPKDDRRQLAWIASAAWGADRAYTELIARRRASLP